MDVCVCVCARSADDMVLRVEVACQGGVAVSGVADVSDLLHTPTEPVTVPVALQSPLSTRVRAPVVVISRLRVDIAAPLMCVCALRNSQCFGRINLLLSTLHHAHGGGGTKALAPTLATRLQLEVCVLAVTGVLWGGPQSPSKRGRASGVGSCFVRAALGTEAGGIVSEPAATTDSTTVSSGGDGVWRTGGSVTLGAQVTNSDAVFVRLEVVTPMVASPTARPSTAFIVLGTVCVYVPREVLVLPGYHRRVVTKLTSPLGAADAGTLHCVLRRTETDVTSSPVHSYIGRQRAYRLLKATVVEADVTQVNSFFLSLTGVCYPLAQNAL